MINFNENTSNGKVTCYLCNVLIDERECQLFEFDFGKDNFTVFLCRGCDCDFDDVEKIALIEREH